MFLIKLVACILIWAIYIYVMRWTYTLLKKTLIPFVVDFFKIVVRPEEEKKAKKNHR